MVENNLNKIWELEYSEGRMLNKYPHDRLVSLTFKYFGNVKDRSKIKVLDLGCGAGNNSWFFAKEGFDVTGIDVSRKAIDYARNRFASENLKGYFIDMEMNNIDKLNDRYDLVIDRATLTTQDWESIVTIMKKIKKVMKNESIIISFMYSLQHPAKKYYKRTDDGRTYFNDDDKFLLGKRVTFLDENALFELFSEFQIIELYHHSLKPILLQKGVPAGMAEFISIAKKVSD